ncbi:MAG: iron-sulfur cluster assembly scaffold protein [Candidatus Diapherotrites archaeon]|nr:iron-sulfur cluster assembly scaffold protein [Candidatus Diapherotrites archaeon]
MDSSAYTEIILELYRNPPNYGGLAGHNLKATGGNPSCGDMVSFEAKIEDGKISDVRFTATGCAISKAGSAMLTEMVKGKTVEDALKLEGKDLFENVGQVIHTRTKCALLGLVVFKRGLEKFEENDQEKTIVEGIKI